MYTKCDSACTFTFFLLHSKLYGVANHMTLKFYLLEQQPHNCSVAWKCYWWIWDFSPKAEVSTSWRSMELLALWVFVAYFLFFVSSPVVGYKLSSSPPWITTTPCWQSELEEELSTTKQRGAEGKKRKRKTRKNVRFAF